MKDIKVHLTPYITGHALDEFRRHVYNAPDDKIRKALHYGWFNGHVILTQHDGSKIIRVEYDAYGKKVTVYLVIQPRGKLSGKLIMKTVLSEAEYISYTQMKQK